MDIRYGGKTIWIDDKIITSLDRFVLDFIGLLGSQTGYVIVSGYVAILFGRSRGTEDVDILLPRLEGAAFGNLHDQLLKQEYEFLNAEDAPGLFDMLVHGMGIRVAQKGRVIPNIELKFLKDETDRQVFRDRVEVNFSGSAVCISPIEIQIAYKLYLGSEKDVEDALYLWEIFREDLDKELLKNQMNRFCVRGDEYGIGV